MKEKKFITSLEDIKVHHKVDLIDATEGEGKCKEMCTQYKDVSPVD